VEVEACCGFFSTTANGLAGLHLLLSTEELEQGVLGQRGILKGPRAVSEEEGVMDAIEGEPGSFVEEGVNGVIAASPKSKSSELSSGVPGSDGSALMVL
jgi:hypothetical protein